MISCLALYDGSGLGISGKRTKPINFGLGFFCQTTTNSPTTVLIMTGQTIETIRTPNPAIIIVNSCDIHTGNVQFFSVENRTGSYNHGFPELEELLLHVNETVELINHSYVFKAVMFSQRLYLQIRHIFINDKGSDFTVFIDFLFPQENYINGKGQPVRAGINKDAFIMWMEAISSDVTGETGRTRYVQIRSVKTLQSSDSFHQIKDYEMVNSYNELNTSKYCELEEFIISFPGMNGFII